MILNPIHRVLSVLHTHNVRFLLMGGQACVLYGGAEFSRDTDIVILPHESNLHALQSALNELAAEVIAVPQFSRDNLLRGHAVHFRCHDKQAGGIRLDVMSVMRGLDSFELLWQRRTTVELDTNLVIDLLSLPDLVKAKKTQRDKDWPMIRRLIEADFEKYGDNPKPSQLSFWIQEARTPAILRELYRRHPFVVEETAQNRKLLSLLPFCSDMNLEKALRDEEETERNADRAYWEPLRRELENMRHEKKAMSDER